MQMRKTRTTGFVAAAAVSLLALGMSASAMAQNQTRDQTRDQTRLQDPIYGSQLMTLPERNEYRTRMRSLKTEQEREAFRLEHHQQMQERARAKGITLPETPPARGMGAGMGAGTGPGPGPGPGGGPGSGMGGGMGAGGKK
jgi:hypothetical protein